MATPSNANRLKLQRKLTDKPVEVKNTAAAVNREPGSVGLSENKPVDVLMQFIDTWSIFHPFVSARPHRAE